MDFASDVVRKGLLGTPYYADLSFAASDSPISFASSKRSACARASAVISAPDNMRAISS